MPEKLSAMRAEHRKASAQTSSPVAGKVALRIVFIARKRGRTTAAGSLPAFAGLRGR